MLVASYFINQIQITNIYYIPLLALCTQEVHLEAFLDGNRPWDRRNYSEN